MPSVETESHLDVVIVDAFSLLFRAFHSFPPHLTSPTGELTNAVFGFTRLLLDMLKKINPEYLVVAADTGEPTFRHVEYVGYKANREEAPHELTSQIGSMYDVLDALNIPTLKVVGFEADDVIGTLAVKFAKEHPDLRVGIFTGDRDAFQLVKDNIFVLLPPRPPQKTWFSLIDAEEVIARFGVRPDQVVDYKALCGDASDNIPGVKGVGPKTAAKLLMDFDTLEGIYNNLDSDKIKGSLLTKLAQGHQSAILSQKLARIDTTVPVEFELAQAEMCDYDQQKALDLFTKLGFDSMKKHLPADSFAKGVQAALF